MKEKTITIDLSLKSLDAAIMEIGKLANDIDEALAATAEGLTQFGEDMAESYFKNSVATLVAGDGPDVGFGSVYDEEERTGQVMAFGEEAAFYEYGTGYVGMNAPHPGIVSGESTPPIVFSGGRAYTQYDTYNHGPDGWYYFDWEDGKYRHTVGMVGLAYMYDTYKQLRELAPGWMELEMEKRGVME